MSGAQRSTQETGPRRNWNGQVLCHAHSTRTGELCNAIAMKGQKVCSHHGGMTGHARRKAKLRLQELVDPAIATLAREMTSAASSKDRMAAANSILDRAGWGRISQVEVGDARELLIQRLIDMRDEQMAEPQPELQSAPITIDGTVDDDGSTA